MQTMPSRSIVFGLILVLTFQSSALKGFLFQLTHHYENPKKQIVMFQITRFCS
jgi:hypothetical protein